MDLYQHLLSQGVAHERALDLLDRKRIQPALTGCVVGGKWITLQPATGVKFDEMIESGRGPYLSTDVEFLAGSENGRQFQGRPEQGDFYRRVAEGKGQNVKGKKYISQLARYPGDPEAFVGGRGDVQKVLEQRGWGSDGSVKVKGKPREEASAPVDIAEDILERETNKIAAATPGMNTREKLDLREKVRNRIKPKYKRK